jgi:hypothetical protein
VRQSKIKVDKKIKRYNEGKEEEQRRGTLVLSYPNQLNRTEKTKNEKDL